ncbi:hypothetical protein [Martelella endophytica]|uniref:hypothetical protein n=1 Tax=Martelella endophytica TaxID=1486262 RepID=UPI0011859BE4|nr:hypothetical protein [Martelella endophytica]
MSSYLPAMVSPRARASTLRVLPMVDLTVASQQQLYPTFATLGRLSLLEYAPQKQSGIAPAFSI